MQYLGGEQQAILEQSLCSRRRPEDAGTVQREFAGERDEKGLEAVIPDRDGQEVGIRQRQVAVNKGEPGLETGHPFVGKKLVPPRGDWKERKGR